ncbi:MAG: hypothetical protein JO168_10845 [Solirubrobacterales bacterium]|nr:hypothetical protein [Solirubrobacterales bacterium]
MSGEQRRRLATAAARARYPGELLQSIAQATLPTYTAGKQLAERQLEQVAEAVELLAKAGLSAEHVGAHLATCRRRAPQKDWRERCGLSWREPCAPMRTVPAHMRAK